MKNIYKTLLLISVFLFCNNCFAQNSVLLSPLNHAIVEDTFCSLQWDSPYDSGFQVQVATNSTFSTIVNDSFPVDTRMLNVSDLILGTTYYWRVRQYANPADTVWSNTFSFKCFNPQQYADLSAWFRSDSGVTADLSGLVSLWKDASDAGHNAVQNNGTLKPLLVDSINQLNNYPVIQFDGGQCISFPETAANGYTISAIVSTGSTKSPEEAFLGTWDNSSPDLRSWYLGIGEGIYGNGYNACGAGGSFQDVSLGPGTFIDTGRFYLLTYTKSATEWKVYCNSTFIRSVGDTYTQAYSGTANWVIGCADNYFRQKKLTGQVAEVVIFNRVIDSTERKSVENYLYDKYSPPVNLGPDIVSNYGLCNTYLDAGNRFTSYLWSTGQTTPKISIEHSGTYWVQATNIFNQISRDTINVTVSSPPRINDTVICQFSNAHYSTSLGAGYHFLWSNADTTTYTDYDQAGMVWVEINDTLGCSWRDTAVVAVDSFPSVASLGPDRSLCRGEGIGLVAGLEYASAYSWSTGSGAPMIPVTNAIGTYQDYAVTVTSNIGCLASDTIQVFAKGDVPSPQFKADSVCPGLVTDFLDLSTAPAPTVPAAWLWVFGDGDSSQVQNPSHVFPQAGIYNTQLKVTTDAGCAKTITKSVVVWAKPNVYFTPNNGCDGVSIPFSDHSVNSLGTNTSWFWDFGLPGNTDTSSLRNPGFMYPAPGAYTVSLVVNSLAGCSDTLQRIINIKEAPLPAFSYNTACSGKQVFFIDTTLTTVPTQVISRKWLFGDGDSSLSYNPVHVFDTAGSYNVTLRLFVLNGCTATSVIPVVVHPTPLASIANSNLCVATEGPLNDGSSVTGDVLTNWKWTINGSLVLNTQNPLFTPDSIANYKVLLQVTTASGCSDTTVKWLSAMPLPVADFSFSPEYGTAPLDVSFSNLSQSYVSSYWDFGDSFSSLLDNPDHTYTANGTYPVTLTVTSAYGCSNTYTDNVYVLNLVSDIAVSNVKATTDGDLLRMSCTLTNLGTHQLNALDLSAYYNKGSMITEHWSGNLAPGAALPYVFTAGLELPATRDVDYACVKAAISGINDTYPENNSACAVLNESFLISDPYPNPVVSVVNVDVILPFADQVEAGICNEAGKRVALIYSGSAARGYNRFSYDTSILQAGNYAVFVYFRDKKEVRKFVVTH
jgi:PKD repeat protein